MWVLAIFTILFSIAAHSQSTCSIVRKDSVSDIGRSSKDILKETHLQYAQSDMKDFCKRNIFLRYLNTKDNPPPNCERLPLDQLEALVDETVKKSKGNRTPWARSLIGTHTALNESLAMFSDQFPKLEVKENLPPFDAAARFREIKANSATVDSSEASSMFTAICLKEIPLSFQSCIKGLKIIEKKASPIGGFVHIELWEKIYSDKKYDEGLRLAALKIKSRVDGNLVKDANIFEDIKSSFVASGMSASDATSAAWNVLGAISSRGQNTSMATDAIDPDWTRQKSMALNVIAAGMTFIDMKKEDKGWPLYSYPPEVNNSCNNLKPYHFWMSGHLARELRKEGLDANVAAKVAYLAQQGYQIKRNATGAALSENAILTRQPFDPAHQIVRTDLAFSAGGAVFGAESFNQTLSKKIDVDAAIVSLIANGAVEPALNKEEAKSMGLASTYFRWTNIFSPNAGLDKIKKP